VLLAGGSLLIPVKVKATWILPDDDIVEKYNAEDSPVSVINSIRQIFGYIAHNKCRYGILSTYDRTWFLLRPKNDPATLFISDVVKREDKRPTLLRCFAYIMSLARQDSDCPSYPPLPPQILGDSESPEERDDEDKDPTYQPPKGSSSGFGGAGGAVAEGMKARRAVTATQEMENLNHEKRRMIKGVLASIHGEGFLHGHVRCKNILVEDCYDGPKIKIIDFGFSRAAKSRNARWQR